MCRMHNIAVTFIILTPDILNFSPQIGYVLQLSMIVSFQFLLFQVDENDSIIHSSGQHNIWLPQTAKPELKFD